MWRKSVYFDQQQWQLSNLSEFTDDFSYLGPVNTFVNTLSPPLADNNVIEVNVIDSIATQDTEKEDKLLAAQLTDHKKTLGRWQIGWWLVKFSNGKNDLLTWPTHAFATSMVRPEGVNTTKMEKMLNLAIRELK